MVQQAGGGGAEQARRYDFWAGGRGGARSIPYTGARIPVVRGANFGRLMVPSCVKAALWELVQQASGQTLLLLALARSLTQPSMSGDRHA